MLENEPQQIDNTQNIHKNERSAPQNHPEKALPGSFH
jgi:hypothetical protein